MSDEIIPTFNNNINDLISNAISRNYIQKDIAVGTIYKMSFWYEDLREILNLSQEEYANFRKKGTTVMNNVGSFAKL